MNAGNYKLAKSDDSLKVQPEAKLKFAHLLVKYFCWKFPLST